MVKNFLAYLLFSAILVIIFVSGYETISLYYKANPYINGIILLTLIVGFLLYTVKIISLSSEYRFMNSVAFGKLKINDSSLNSYPITKSIAKNLGIISSSNTISKTLDEILDELLSNIESGKDISKYLINLAVFLGLIGVSNGLANILGSSTWAEIYGVKYIGSIKALTTAFMVFSTAFGTAVFGLLIDEGFTIENIAFVGASYVVISLALLIIIRKTIEPVRLPN